VNGAAVVSVATVPPVLKDGPKTAARRSPVHGAAATVFADFRRALCENYFSPVASVYVAIGSGNRRLRQNRLCEASRVRLGKAPLYCDHLV
jgi:hypothetical protein